MKMRFLSLAASLAATTATITPARRVCRPGPPAAAALGGGDGGAALGSVLIIGDSISLGAMHDLTAALQSAATVAHAPFSGDGGALDVKYAMDTDLPMTGAGVGPPWIAGAGKPARFGDGCLNGTFLVTTTQQPVKYDVISFNYGVHDVDYSHYDEEWVPLALYEENIRTIKHTLQATGSKVVFQSSTPVEYNLTTNKRILAYNAAAKAVMAEPPAAVYNDLYGAITAVCGHPPYNAPTIKGAPNCSISDYNGVHYHEGGWQTLANSTAQSILKLLKTADARRGPEPELQPLAGSIKCDAAALFAAAAADGSLEQPVSGHDFDLAEWSAPHHGDEEGSGGAPTPTSCPANSTCMVTAFSNSGLGCCMGYGTKAVA